MILSASATLAFTAWGYAGVIEWTLHTMMLGGALTLFAAVLPMPPFKGSLDPLVKLIKFPAFWFSLCFLLYVLIQAFNPSVAVVHGEKSWWVESIEPPLAEWLPSGVRAEFGSMNAFRVFEIFAASFTLMWGLWVGLSRRKSVLIVLWTLILSGSAMAFVAILQDLSEADKVLWTIKSANKHFWGSFFYRNQGAAYLNLTLIGIGVLYFYYSKRSIERAQQGGPHFLLFLLFACVVSSVGLALSRGGILFASILTIGFLSFVLLQRIFAAFTTKNSWVIACITGLILAGGAYGVGSQVDLDAIQERFGDIEATIENAESDARAISSKATWDMAQDNLLTGWGAGSFRYMFPIYQKKYPEIFYSYFHKRSGEWRGRKLYHYAHNDILQFLAEYGAIGCGLLILTFASLLVIPIFQSFKVAALSSLFLVLGVACALAHAFLDFIFNSPAYWVAMVGLLALLAKLLHLEARRQVQKA